MGSITGGTVEAETLVSLLHEALKQLCPFVRNDGYFRHCGRDDECFALVQEDALSVGAEEAALTAQTHIDAEAVDARVVALEGLCEL